MKFLTPQPIDYDIDIAPGSSPLDSPTAWQWERAGSIREAAKVTIHAGRDDEAQEVEPGSLAATLDDRDGNLSPRNILGKWYGRIQRGTPLRMRLNRTTDTFTRSGANGFGTSDEGYTWSSNNSAYSVVGTRGRVLLPYNVSATTVLTGAGSLDAELLWATTLSGVPTAGTYVTGAVFRHTDNTRYVRAHVELRQDGTITVKVQRRIGDDTVELLNTQATGQTYGASDTVWARARMDGPTIMVRAWRDGTPEPTVWHGVATETLLEGSNVGLFHWNINNNGGTFYGYVDSFTVTNLLWSGTVPEWPVRWPDKSGNDSITTINAAGVLRRLQQGNGVVQSPLYRQLSGLSYGAQYIPGEDDSGATSAASGLSGAPAATVSGVTFGADTSLGGSASSFALDTAGTSRISGTIPRKDFTAGQAAMFLMRLDSLPAADTTVMTLRATGTATRWEIYFAATAIGYRAYNVNGDLLASSAALWTVDPTQWTAIQLETNVSGGVVHASLVWTQVGSGNFYASDLSFSGSATRLDSFALVAPTDNMSAAHLWFGSSALPFVDNTFSLVASGYVGEKAADRIRRLCSEAGVPVAVYEGDTEAQGRQRTAKLVDLLRESEQSDLGVLFERGPALGYLPRTRRYSPPVAMTLDWSAGQLAEPPEPTDDDQRLTNQWTVSRTEGSSATATDDDSVDAHGLYDQQIEVNVQGDSRLIDIAGFLLNIGTADELRWPRINLDLIANPELIPLWLACRVGSRIRVINPPSQIAGEDIDLIIEGYSQTIGLYTWDVEISAAPSSPWMVAQYDSGFKYDAPARTRSALNPTDRLVGLTAESRDGFWSWLSTPYDVTIAGQRNRVIGMSQPDSIAMEDGTFETGALGTWYATGGTLTATAAQANRGTYSALLTTNASPANASARSSRTVTVAAGDVLRVDMWVRCPTARTVYAAIDWYGSSGLLSTTSNPTAVPANTWTMITVTGTAPSSTTRVEYGPTIQAPPSNGIQLYLDDVDVIRTSSPNSRQLALLTRGVDGYSKALPLGSRVTIANPSPGRYAL